MSDEPKKSDEFAKMFGESLAAGSKKGHRYSPGDKVRCEILVVGREQVFVSLSSQKDGIIPTPELLDAEGKVPYKAGDKLDLYVTQIKGGEVFLSPNRQAKNFADDLEDAFDMMLPVEGRVEEIVKGGFRVVIHGKRAFCPISQLDIKHIELTPENTSEYLGKKLEFRITAFTEGGRNIVVSRRKILEEEGKLAEGSFLAEHKPGDVVSGKVKRLEKFGAFIELAPGLEGLAHISELSWSRVENPAEILSVSQEVRVKILKIELVEGRTRIGLSIKQTGEAPLVTDPWTLVAQKFPVGTIFQGRVERREPYGLFISVEPGVTALLPKSKALENPEFPFDKFKVGDMAMVQVGELRLSERRISLQVPRDPGADDWKGYVTPESAPAGGGFGSLGDQMKKALEKKAAGKK